MGSRFCELSAPYCEKVPGRILHPVAGAIGVTLCHCREKKKKQLWNGHIIPLNVHALVFSWLLYFDLSFWQGIQQLFYSSSSRYVQLYHDAWVDERYRHSIYSPYTLVQPFIFPYTLGCMVARTTNALAVANDPQLSRKHWLIESWYKSAVPWASGGVWVRLTNSCTTGF